MSWSYSAEQVTLDSKVKIELNAGGSDLTGTYYPIEGSLNISTEDNLTIAKYEGGAVAGASGEIKYNMTFQTFGKFTDSYNTSGIYTGVGVKIETEHGGSFERTGTVASVKTSWTSDFGFISEFTMIG